MTAAEKIYALDGTLAFEVGPNGDHPGVRVTTHLPRGGTLSIPLDEDNAAALAVGILSIAPDDEDGEQFCPRCAAGVDSPEHHEKCVLLGWAIDGEPSPVAAPSYWTAPGARPTTHCAEHGTTLPCAAHAGDHAAGLHTIRAHAECPRCATPPAQIDAVSLAAADDTLTETEETP